MFGQGNAQLPLPPMRMFDRIVSITEDGAAASKGQIIAKLDIKPDPWFFECHFAADPVLPGCPGLDAMWQLRGRQFWNPDFTRIVMPAKAGIREETPGR